MLQTPRLGHLPDRPHFYPDYIRTNVPCVESKPTHIPPPPRQAAIAAVCCLAATSPAFASFDAVSAPQPSLPSQHVPFWNVPSSSGSKKRRTIARQTKHFVYPRPDTVHSVRSPSLFPVRAPELHRRPATWLSQRPYHVSHSRQGTQSPLAL